MLLIFDLIVVFSPVLYLLFDAVIVIIREWRFGVREVSINRYIIVKKSSIELS